MDGIYRLYGLSTLHGAIRFETLVESFPSPPQSAMSFRSFLFFAKSMERLSYMFPRGVFLSVFACSKERCRRTAMVSLYFLREDAWQSEFHEL